MPDTPGNFDDDGPVTGKQTISIVATLLRFFRQNAVERSHKCIDFQQRTTRPKSVQSAISLSIKGVLAPEASPFSTELSTGFCGTLLPGDSAGSAASIQTWSRYPTRMRRRSTPRG